MFKRNPAPINYKIQFVYRSAIIYVICFMIVFFGTTLLTTSKVAHRFSSHILMNFTSELDSQTMLYLIGKENRLYQQSTQDMAKGPKFSQVMFEVMTQISPDDPRSFLGRELPGFPYLNQRFVVGGSDQAKEFILVESAPPLEEIMKDRQAIFIEQEDEEIEEGPTEAVHQTEQEVVFIYNTHNRESFLPHLPEVTKPNHAYHESVNISKASEHFAKALKNYGISSYVDQTDFTNILHDKNWNYRRSYDASREVVQEVFQTNEHIQYVFDIHRDSLPKEQTTLEADGKSYGKILFVIGAENPSYEKNLSLATLLHEQLEKKLPGLSRGVITKKGAGTNGLYNQDLLENSLLVEVGGYDNELNHIYRSLEVLAEVFSEHYWAAEKVDKQIGKEN